MTVRERSQRADAQRNFEALVTAGAELLAVHGPELPFEEVAKAAGVGKGTLYRHFPTRDHLIAVVLRDRFSELATEAATLMGEDDGLDRWLRSFDRIPVRYRGLSARVSETLADDQSVIASACIPMKDAFSKLLLLAQNNGTVRQDIRPVELLSVVAALPDPLRTKDGSSKYLDVLLRGLRT